MAHFNVQNANYHSPAQAPDLGRIKLLDSWDMECDNKTPIFVHAVQYPILTTDVSLGERRGSLRDIEQASQQRVCTNLNQIAVSLRGKQSPKAKQRSIQSGRTFCFTPTIMFRRNLPFMGDTQSPRKVQALFIDCHTLGPSKPRWVRKYNAQKGSQLPCM